MGRYFRLKFNDFNLINLLVNSNAFPVFLKKRKRHFQNQYRLINVKQKNFFMSFPQSYNLKTTSVHYIILSNLKINDEVFSLLNQNEQIETIQKINYEKNYLQ